MATPQRKNAGGATQPEKKTASLISDAKLKQLYATMLQCRLLDDHLKTSQKRDPRKRKHASFRGQEASLVGSSIDLRAHDWIVASPGSSPAAFVKSVSMEDLLAVNAGAREKRNVLDVEMNPAMQLSVAAGLSLALKIRNRDGIAIAYTTLANMKGDAVDTLNYAVSRLLPLIVVTPDNLDRHRKPGVKNKPELAFPVIPVDGADVVAMYRVASESIHKARHGGGPTLIQTVAWKQAPVETTDPILRMEEYLAAKGLFPAGWKRRLAERFEKKLATFPVER